MKILVDTNIIVDVLTGREPFRETTEQIFMLAANQVEIKGHRSFSESFFLKFYNLMF